MTDPTSRLQDGKEICRMVYIPSIKDKKGASKGKRTLCSEHKEKKPVLNDQIAAWNFAELLVTANTNKKSYGTGTQKFNIIPRRYSTSSFKNWYKLFTCTELKK